MSRVHRHTIEITLDDFDDEDILQAARDIGMVSMDEDRVDDLVLAILHGTPEDALRRLRDLLANDARLLNRVDVVSTRKVFA